MKDISKQLENMPRKISSAVTTPQVFHKERHEKGVDYYKEVTYTSDGDMIFNGKIQKEKISISRATCNFSGAYPYLFDVISYVCTHAKEAIIEADNYYSVTIPYEKFLEFALDDCTGQLRYLQNELYRLDKAKQSKLIALNENTSLYALPVVLAYKAGDRPLAQKGKRGAEQLGAEVHQEIQILFLKCLFQDIKENNNRYIDFPKALFAKLKSVEKAFENKYVFKEPITGLNRLVDKKELQRLIKKYELITDISDLKPLDGAITAEIVYKLLNYFRIHDNSQSEKIRLKGIDILKHCAPQYIQTRKNRQGTSIDYYQDTDEAKAFLMLLTIAINEVCRAGILNALPETKMRNLITHIENVGSGDILIYYGNRKKKPFFIAHKRQC
ncbi:MAG: hypothetical protein LBH73_07985 [Spirochaetaceae bacterium]|jgi:hypothetical protein|nr:hypothetical protein [Spirochaetaceae bacterium]